MRIFPQRKPGPFPFKDNLEDALDVAHQMSAEGRFAKDDVAVMYYPSRGQFLPVHSSNAELAQFAFPCTANGHLDYCGFIAARV